MNAFLAISCAVSFNFFVASDDDDEPRFVVGPLVCNSKLVSDVVRTASTILCVGLAAGVRSPIFDKSPVDDDRLACRVVSISNAKRIFDN